MNRTQYKTARRVIRDNGRFALKWLNKEAAQIFDFLFFSQKGDALAERADIVAYCKREGLACNLRHTAARAPRPMV